MPVHSSSSDPLIGSDLGHYRILRQIGSGGMGVVYLAHDSRLDRDVAVKLLSPGTLSDETARHRFHNEARALSKLNHPNIATVHDFDTQRGADFLVMEYIPGKSLKDALAGGPLAEPLLLSLAIQLADGLAAAHDHSIIHRDLKPGNLLLGPEDRLKILDFGLAKLRVPSLESVTQSALESACIAGTIPYMSPEQILGADPDPRSDIFSAGLVLYEMATGQRPFAELASGKILDAILHRPPIPPRKLNPHISFELERIIQKCTEKDPASRYQTARDLGVDLRRLQHNSSSETVIGERPVSRRPRFRFSKPLIASIAGLVVALGLVALLLPRSRHILGSFATGTPRVESIAVLPLANLSGDPEREFFADGVTEELITQLGKSTGLRVISRQSVMQFKHTTLPLSEIAHKLDVDAIVEGSVLQSGNRVRVTARLVPASSEKPLWADEYDRDLRDIIALQSEVTQAIASEIRLKLSPEEKARLSSRPVNPEAYEAYLKGRAYWYQISKPNYEQAERYFRLALEKDPNFALAYSGLADVWLMRTDTGYLASSEVLGKAKEYALKAIALDPSLAEPEVSLANITVDMDHDAAAGERHFRRAIEVNPSSALAHFMYADFLISYHRNAEWDVEAHKSLALDPMYFFWRTFYGWHLNYLHRDDEAIETLQTVLAGNPTFSSAHLGLWVAYFSKGKDQEAFSSAVHFFDALGDHETVEALQAGFAAGGYREAMRRGGDLLAARSQKSHVSGVRIARLYAHAGQTDLALTWLEKAVDTNEIPIFHLAVARDWDALRTAPRFKVLLRRLNLPEQPVLH